MIYDTLIVGGGPAGLSAALLLGRCLRTVLLCDGGDPRNKASAAIHGLLGNDYATPSGFIAKGQAELKRYPTLAQRRTLVTALGRAPPGFAFECADGTQGRARKVLLSTGLCDDLPKIEGVSEFYGRSVHHCLYCDAFEHSGHKLAAYGKSEKGPGLALAMKQWSSDVVLCTDGAALAAADVARLGAHGIVIRTEPVTKLEGSDGCLKRIIFADGSAIDRTALFFATGCGPKSRLAKDLGCSRDRDGGVKADALTGETTVAGAYVAGDASRDVLLIAVAIAEGAKAAVAINKALLKEDGLG